MDQYRQGKFDDVEMPSPPDTDEDGDGDGDGDCSDLDQQDSEESRGEGAENSVEMLLGQVYALIVGHCLALSLASFL